MTEHVLEPGEGWYAGTLVCSCGRAILPEDAEAHSAPPTPSLSALNRDPVERDRRESAARFEDQGGAA